MLCDINASELEQIRRVVVWSLNVVQRDEFQLVERAYLVYLVKDEHAGEEESKAGIHVTLEFDAAHAFELLTEHAILRPAASTYIGGPPPNIVATRAVFSKLRQILTGYEGEGT
jgi:hypothetical protein